MADNDSYTGADSPYGFFTTPDKDLDRWLGSLTTLLEVFGISGNILALFYFSLMERKSLPDKIYIAIIIVDIITNITLVPSASFLLSNRDSILCNNLGSHLAAVILLRFSTKFSSLLVAVLSVLRSVVIVKPHKGRQIKARKIAFFLAGCATFILLKDVIPATLGWLAPESTFYFFDCPRLYISSKMPDVANLLVQIIDTIEVFLTSVVVFTSFIFTTISLMKKRIKPTSNLDSERRFRQVSITITLFTALFLLCNLPFFVWYMFLILVRFVKPIEQNVTSFILRTRSKWIIWNGNIIFSFLPLHLNTVLNPCLYLWRMPRYREQLSIWWTKFKEKLTESLDSIRSCSSE